MHLQPERSEDRFCINAEVGLRYIGLMIREIRHERYAEWADEVLSVANKVLQDWPSEQSSDAQDFFPSIAHSICISHTERLKAAVTLYRAGLGNHAAPFVRIAYEENTWIYYLATIEDCRLRNELLSRMANLNVMQRVRTQSTFFGEDEAKATGFLGSAHGELAPQFEQNCKVSKSWQRSSAGHRAEPVVGTQARSPRLRGWQRSDSLRSTPYMVSSRNARPSMSTSALTKPCGV